MYNTHMETVTIGTLQTDQWKEYRDIWLEALEETPEAFFAAYEDQKEQPDSVWKRRLESVLKEEGAIVVFALQDGKPVGFLGGYFDDNPKFRHVCTIWGAYVKKDLRKQGIAKRMMEAFVKKIEDRKEIKKIKTYSVTNELLAVNIYKSFGFDLIGISKNELCINNTYVHVYLMEKMV